MFRLKRQQQVPVLPLPVRRLWTVGASASIALSSYILVGYCIKEVAGAATLVAVLISSALAFITGMAYVELTRRTQVTGSPYSFCYTYLGELPAFFVGWAVVGECALGASLMGKAITYYSDFLTGGRLVASLVSCCSLAGKVDQRLWSFFDPVAMAAVIIVGVVCAVNSNIACKINQSLLLVNFITVIVTIVYNSVEGSTENWHNSTSDTSIFLPEEYGMHGVFKASGIYMHVFLSLATTATLATQHRGAFHSSAISMVVTAIVAIIAVSKAASVSLLQPYYELNIYTPVPTFMKNVTDHDFTWVANVNCLGAIVASTAGILSMLVLSANTLEQMVSDGLLWSKLAARRPSISPAGTTLFTTVVAAIGAAFQDYEGLILCLSSGTFLVFQALLIAVMVSRSHASRETALLIVLKFTWLLYFFVSPALVVVTNQFGETRAQSAVQGVLSGVVLMFLQLAINRQQLGVKVVIVQVCTSLVMGFSSYLMYQLHEWAWYRLFIWSFIGVMIYTLYGYHKSHLGRGIVDLTVVPDEECVRSLEEGLDNLGFQHELADLGVGRLRRTQRSLGGHSYASARSRHKESFHSAHEEDVGRQSFQSVQDGDDDRKDSFKSFQESLKSSRAPSEVGVQGDSSSGRGPGQQDSVRDVADGGRGYTAPVHRQGGGTGSFKSVKSDTNGGSFKSFRSEEGRGSFQGARPGGRRRRVTTDSWKSAASGSSQRSGSSGQRRPGAAMRVSPPNSRRTMSADLTRTPPPKSRHAKPGTLTRTPPPTSRRATPADLTRTPPTTPRSRGSVEILINPRRLCEEMYATAAPPPMNAAPVNPSAWTDPHRELPEGEPVSAAMKDSVLVLSGGKPDREQDDESDISSEFDWDGSSDGQRVYSEADIEASGISSSNGGRSASLSSVSGHDGSVTTLSQETMSLNGHDRTKMAQLGIGDFAPVPRGKRSLSYSDISYDDESDPSPGHHLTSIAKEAPKKDLSKPTLVSASKEEGLIRSDDAETSDDGGQLVEKTPARRTNHSENLAQPPLGLVPDILVSSKQSIGNLRAPKEVGTSAAPRLDVQPRADLCSSAESVTSEDDNRHSIDEAHSDQSQSSITDPDRQFIPTAAATTSSEQKQPHVRGFHPEQGHMLKSSNRNPDGSYHDLLGREENDGYSTESEDSDKATPGSIERKQDSPESKVNDRVLSNTEESDKHATSTEEGEDSREVRGESHSSSFDGEGKSETPPGYHSRSDSEGSSASPATDEPPVPTRSSLSDDARSLHESGVAPVEAAVAESDGSSVAVCGPVPSAPDSDADTDASLTDRDSNTSSDEAGDAWPGTGGAVREDEAGEVGAGELRPVVRRQMRLPPVPADARWLARTPTPPGLFTALQVAEGSRLAIGRSTSLPSLSSSSDSGEDSSEGSQAPQPRPGQVSDDSGDNSSEGSPAPHGMPTQVSDGSKDNNNESFPVRQPWLGQVNHNSGDDSSDGSPVSRRKLGQVRDGSGDNRREESPASQQLSRQISDSSEDGSPVPLRRARQTSPRPAAGRAASLQGAPPTHSPGARLGSLPPLNPEYRAIYRPAEQPSFGQVATRWKAVQRARETFVHADDEQRAVSFVAAPLDEPEELAELDELNSSGLQVRPELDRLSRRLAAKQQVTEPATGAGGTNGSDSARTALPLSQDGQDCSPDIIYC